MSAAAAASNGGASPQTYYEILNVSPTLLRDQDLHPGQLLKRAYHRALLRHHPDKAKSELGVLPPATSSQAAQQARSATPAVTIDQITAAYKTLSDPKARAAYDLSLRSSAAQGRSQGEEGGDGQQQQQHHHLSSFQTGVENVDLDDLAFDEAADCWFRGCRCGNDRGFAFGEADLEDAAGEGGELLVGCADCSLWLKVHFAVVDE